MTAVTDGTTATQYTYDGMGRRISQSVNSVVTQYLLDLQPGLEVVLGATTGSDTLHYVHGLTGIHAQQDSTGAWNWMMQDGLGSVRSVVDTNLNVLESRLYQPYGVEFGTTGTRQTVYSFTGEMRDPIGLQYHRARYLKPALGMFTSLDPFEGMAGRPMSLNGYSWVEGNVPNAVDPSGRIYELPSMWATCTSMTIQETCAITDRERAENILAVTSYRETDAGGPLSQNDEVIAALMLMQFNNIRTGTGNIPAAGVTWRQIGSLDYSSINATTFAGGIDQRIIRLAELMVEGYCDYGSDPLALFTYSYSRPRLPVFRNRTDYPLIRERLNALRLLAQNDEAKFEVSFINTYVNDVLNRPDLYGSPYIVTDPGSDTAIMVGRASITDLNAFYQCREGFSVILREGVDPAVRGKQRCVQFDCIRCQTSGRIWYATRDGFNFEEMGEDEFQPLFQQGQVAGFVKSCTALERTPCSND